MSKLEKNFNDWFAIYFKEHPTANKDDCWVAWLNSWEQHLNFIRFKLNEYS